MKKNYEKSFKGMIILIITALFWVIVSWRVAIAVLLVMILLPNFEATVKVKKSADQMRERK